MQTTILNKEVNKIYKLYEDIFLNEKSSQKEKVEAFQMMNVIKSIVYAYEENGHIQAGRLILNQDWFMPDNLNQIMNLITQHLSNTDETMV